MSSTETISSIVTGALAAAIHGISKEWEIKVQGNVAADDGGDGGTGADGGVVIATIDQSCGSSVCSDLIQAIVDEGAVGKTNSEYYSTIVGQFRSYWPQLFDTNMTRETERLSLVRYVQTVAFTEGVLDEGAQSKVSTIFDRVTGAETPHASIRALKGGDGSQWVALLDMVRVYMYPCSCNVSNNTITVTTSSQSVIKVTDSPSAIRYLEYHQNTADDEFWKELPDMFKKTVKCDPYKARLVAAIGSSGSNLNFESLVGMLCERVNVLIDNIQVDVDVDVTSTALSVIKQTGFGTIQDSTIAQDISMNLVIELIQSNTQNMDQLDSLMSDYIASIGDKIKTEFDKTIVNTSGYLSQHFWWMFYWVIGVLIGTLVLTILR